MATITHSAVGRAYYTSHVTDTMYSRSHWYRYNSGVWEQLNDHTLEREVWELLEQFEDGGQARPTLGMHNSVSSYLRAAFYINEDKLDASPKMINMLNGIYDIELGSLLTHSPSQLQTTQLPFEYDPSAKTYEWDKYLNSVLVDKDRNPDPELISFVQEAIGYSLVDTNKHQCSFWCYGESGANGKGVLFKVIEKLAGTAAQPLNVNILRREQYQLADLAGKRIALCSEANATDNLVEDAVIKTLISGDSLQVRQIHRTPFILKPKVKLWWSMNKLPSVADTSGGFWRRIKVIPFNRHFAEDERILDYEQQLYEELPGIFNWAMLGWQRLEYRGCFETPTQVQKETKRYQNESNTIMQYLDDACVRDTNARTKSSVIYSDYKYWCSNNGYRAYSIKSFKREMESLGIYATRLSDGVYFTGVVIKT